MPMRIPQQSPTCRYTRILGDLIHSAMGICYHAHMKHFVDRLAAKIEATGAPICVGIDPVLEKMPRSEQDIESFCLAVLDIVAPHVPIVKFQSACFERYMSHGVACLHRLIRAARQRKLLVILDAKRGDIGATAEHYAAACLADHDQMDGPDALTVNAYFGIDGLKPFLDVAAEQGKGLFALVRTSNPGGDAIQSLKLADGRTVAEGMAELVATIGDDPRYLGVEGYSCLGAVVGATKPADTARLRQLMPRQMFLVPGYGAQGAGAEDVRACFNADGGGAIVTASRSITYAFDDPAVKDWKSPIQAAVTAMKHEIAAISKQSV